MGCVYVSVSVEWGAVEYEDVVDFGLCFYSFVLCGWVAQCFGVFADWVFYVVADGSDGGCIHGNYP